MENVLQQLRSPSSKERKQKRGQTTSVTLPLSAPKHSLPSSGHIFKAQRIKISSKAADSGCVCVFVSITVCVNIFVLQRTNSLHFISDQSGPSVTTAAIWKVRLCENILKERMIIFCLSIPNFNSMSFFTLSAQSHLYTKCLKQTTSNTRNAVFFCNELALLEILFSDCLYFLSTLFQM